ncbi:hypothetical protein L195_g046270, partial [Trifolium pratense]
VLSWLILNGDVSARGRVLMMVGKLDDSGLCVGEKVPAVIAYIGGFLGFTDGIVESPTWSESATDNTCIVISYEHLRTVYALHLLSVLVGMFAMVVSPHAYSCL